MNDPASPSHRHHSTVEERVRESGVPFTFLRPGTFATNLLAWAGPLRGGDVGRELTYQEIPPDAVLPTVQEVTGSPARPSAQWARDHRADFGR
jgi:hypothetical protein